MAWLRRKSTGPEPEQLEAEVEVVLASMRHKAGSTVTFGAPSRCPACGDIGFVDAVDPAAGRTDNRCFACGGRWTITRRALRAVAARGPVEAITPPSSPLPAFWAGPEDEASIIDLVETSEPTSAAVPEAVPSPAEEPTRHPAPSSPEPVPVAREAVVEEPVAADADLRVLLVEDDPADVELVRLVLAPFESTGVSVVHAASRQAGERLASTTQPFDLVLLDLGLPDSSGLSTLSKWQPSRPSPPVVVLSGNENTALASAITSFGAKAFVHKREIVDLVSDDEAAGALVERFRSVAAAGV